MYGQALLTISQTSAGVYTITYNDAANGWAFYNPNSQPIGVNLWINASENSAGTAYTDNWNALTTSLTWDGTNYSGTVNLNNHAFTQGTLPANTTVNQLNFNFTEYPVGNGSHQTGDIQGTKYGFTPSATTTLATTEATITGKSRVVGGKFFPATKGAMQLTVYDFSGKVLRTMSVVADGAAIDLALPQRGMYILKVASTNHNEVVKFNN